MWKNQKLKSGKRFHLYTEINIQVGASSYPLNKTPTECSLFSLGNVYIYKTAKIQI